MEIIAVKGYLPGDLKRRAFSAFALRRFWQQLKAGVRRPCPAIRNFHVAPQRESNRKEEVYE